LHREVVFICGGDRAAAVVLTAIYPAFEIDAGIKGAGRLRREEMRPPIS
jgi:hypothetical protein